MVSNPHLIWSIGIGIGIDLGPVGGIGIGIGFAKLVLSVSGIDPSPRL